MFEINHNFFLAGFIFWGHLRLNFFLAGFIFWGHLRLESSCIRVNRVFFLALVFAVWVYQSMSTEEYTKKVAKRQYGNIRKKHTHRDMHFNQILYP